MSNSEGGDQPGPPWGSAGAGVRVRLLGGFALSVDDATVELPPAAQRLVAFLGLRARPARRALVASHLWPEAGEDGALGSLRSTLWRLRRRCPRVLRPSADALAIDPAVHVDAQELLARTDRILGPDARIEAGDEHARVLREELLPEWWDDWVVLERERLRQRQLHALERLAKALAETGRFASALEHALEAVRAEPLRESARRTLIAVHLAEGNRTEALREYDRYRKELTAELGIAPSPQLEALVRDLTTTPTGGHGSAPHPPPARDTSGAGAGSVPNRRPA